MATKTETAKAAREKAPPESDTEPGGEVTSDCVVNGGKGLHVGRAVNGKVCSYHAMHYDADGNRR